MKINLNYIFFLLFCSCSPQKKHIITSTDLVYKYGDRIFKLTSADGITNEFKDLGLDSIQGGYYIFHSNCSLKTYHFMKNKSISLYTLQFDKQGNLLKEIGTPLVFKSGNLVRDSFNIKLYFSNLINDYKKVEISIPSGISFKINLLNDTLFSNTDCGQFTLMMPRNEQNVKAYIDIEYYNLIKQNNVKFRDSIYVHYKPNKYIKA